MRWSSRATVFIAATTVTCSVGGLVVGVPPVAADIRAQLSYDCTTASGTRRVAVAVAAKIPASGKVGKPIRLGKVAVTVQFPAGIAGLAGVDGVRGSVRLAVTVSQKGQSVEAGWPPFMLTSTKPVGGAVRMTATGAVPSLSPRAPGEVAWHAGALVLTLTREGASQTVLNCAPRRDRVLGRITVGGAAARGAGRQGGTAIPGSVRPRGDDAYFPKCVELPPALLPDGSPNPKGGLNPDPELKLPDPQFGAELGPPSAGIASCTRISGFGSISKLGSATPVAAEGLVRTFRAGGAPDKNYLYLQAYNLGLTTPATSTSLGFGFMPTTVTAVVEQVATVPGGNNFANAIAESEAGAPAPIRFTPRALAKAFVVVRVSHAAANGVPIELGKNADRECRIPPMKVELTTALGGGELGGFFYRDGGTYTGSVIIPAFRPGCGQGEDLSPLLTATTAGGGNLVRLDLGPFCEPLPVDSPCDRSREPLTFTIKPGGETTLHAKSFVINTYDPGVKISCASATMKLTLRKGAWVGQGAPGQVTSAKFADCTHTSASGDVRQTLTLQRLPLPVYLTNSNGRLQMQVGRVLLNSKGADGCLLRLGAQGSDPKLGDVPVGRPIQAPYRNDAHAWELKEGEALIDATFGSSCPDDIPGFFEGQSPVKGQSITATFTTTPRQTITQPDR